MDQTINADITSVFNVVLAGLMGLATAFFMAIRRREVFAVA